MKILAEMAMPAVARRLDDRLAQANGDRARALMDLAARHLRRGRLPAAVAVGLEAVEACGRDAGRRCDALYAVARALLEAEAHDMAAELAARATHDALAAADAGREARARELQGLLFIRRGRYQAARRELRIAGRLHRHALDTLALKRSARGIGDCYRLQAAAAAAAGRQEHAEVNFRQALRAYRAAVATGECANDDAAIAAAAAECEARRGNYGLARIQVDRALALAPRVDDDAVMAQAHLAECRLLRSSGDLRAAEWAGERACVAGRRLCDDTLAQAMLALADVHDAQGRFERATDVESRAREMLLERHRRLARVRSELGSLWGRDATATPTHAFGCPRIHA